LKAQVAGDNGTTATIDTSRQHLVEAVNTAIGGKGAEVIYGSIRKDTFEGDFEMIAMGVSDQTGWPCKTHQYLQGMHPFRLLPFP
jgi:hypothetical protein